MTLPSKPEDREAALAAARDAWQQQCKASTHGLATEIPHGPQARGINNTNHINITTTSATVPGAPSHMASEQPVATANNNNNINQKPLNVHGTSTYAAQAGAT